MVWDNARVMDRLLEKAETMLGTLTIEFRSHHRLAKKQAQASI